MQCQACMDYILAVVHSNLNSHEFFYLKHYPFGKPDETVAAEIPEHIKPDFKEALRCLWVDAYNATVEMCRRALEASCLDLGAPKKKVLEDMIDWLEEKRKITPALKDAAHKIRLGGNRGAHPPSDVIQIAATAESSSADHDGPILKIEKEHAQAVVEFTRHFFQHVYVMPKELSKYDFSRPKS